MSVLTSSSTSTNLTVHMYCYYKLYIVINVKFFIFYSRKDFLKTFQGIYIYISVCVYVYVYVYTFTDACVYIQRVPKTCTHILRKEKNIKIVILNIYQ